MRRGELSSEVLPRVYLVFEGLVGLLPDVKTTALEALARKRKKWNQAVNYYKINSTTAQGTRDLYWRHNFRVDIVTYIHPDFVEPIRDRLNSKNLLFGDVHYFENPVELSREMTYDPSILGVLDPNQSNALTYGSRGRYCSSNELNLMGILI